MKKVHKKDGPHSKASAEKKRMQKAFELLKTVDLKHSGNYIFYGVT
jgi:hypothetical protein